MRGLFCLKSRLYWQSMPNITTIQPYVTLIKDIFTGFAALVAAIIAIRGYDAWKKQLTANAERELARRVLLAVYKVRDTIKNCRLFTIMSEDLDKTKELHDVKMLQQAHWLISNIEYFVAQLQAAEHQSQ